MNPSALLRLAASAVRTAAFAAAIAVVGAQGAPAQDAGPQFPPGSRLGLTPPAGMSPTPAGPGFEDVQNNAFIRLVELPAGAFAEIEKAMTADALKQQGMILERRAALPLPGGSGKGVLLTLRQDTPGGPIRKWLMVGPLSGRTVMVTFELPLSSKAYSDAAVRAALGSVAARDAIPAQEQLALVPFKLSDLAGFRIAAVVPGRAVQLTDGPKDAVDTIDQPHLIAGLIPGAAPRPNERDAFARGVLGGLPPLKEMRITGSESMRIGGQQGHEIRAQGKDAKTGIDVEIVQWIRFGGGVHLRMVGFAPREGWTDAFMRFRAVRDGIEPR